MQARIVAVVISAAGRTFTLEFGERERVHVAEGDLSLVGAALGDTVNVEFTSAYHVTQREIDRMVEAVAAERRGRGGRTNLDAADADPFHALTAPLADVIDISAYARRPANRK